VELLTIWEVTKGFYNMLKNKLNVTMAHRSFKNTKLISQNLPNFTAVTCHAPSSSSYFPFYTTLLKVLQALSKKQFTVLIPLAQQVLKTLPLTLTDS